MQILLVGILGLIGIYGRYFLNSLVHNVLGYEFPIATLIINLGGSFLIGVVYMLGLKTYPISDELRIALMTGLLGGFTTFSAFSLDSVSLFASGRFTFAAIYLAGNVGGGILACLAGIALTRALGT